MKYIKFEVVPVDNQGTVGEAQVSLQAPRIGNVAFEGFVSGDNISRPNSSFGNITNGVTSSSKGGALSINSGATLGSHMIDLGIQRYVIGARVVISARPTDSYYLEYSPDGSVWYSIYTDDYAGNYSSPQFIPFQTEHITFDRIIQARYFRITYTRSATVTFSQIELLALKNDKPVIILNGDTQMKLFIGEVFQEPGFTAYDTEDGDLTHLVIVKGYVDSQTEGEYVLTYEVSDSLGQYTIVERIVTVAAGYPSEGDIAYLKPVTGSGTELPELAFDGNDYSAWIPETDKSYAILDMERPEFVSRFILKSQNLQAFSLSAGNTRTALTPIFHITNVEPFIEANIPADQYRYIRIDVQGTPNNSAVFTLEFHFTTEGMVEYATNSLTIHQNLSEITTDIGLPLTGAFDCNITWTSDNPKFVSNTGTVQRTNQDQKVRLTAVVEKDGIVRTKTFDLIVKAKDNSNSTPSSSNRGSSGGGGGGWTGLPLPSIIYL